MIIEFSWFKVHITPIYQENCQTIYHIYLTNKDKLVWFVLFCCSHQSGQVLFKTKICDCNSFHEILNLM